jgi:peptidoglycan lytic transglycosylase
MRRLNGPSKLFKTTFTLLAVLCLAGTASASTDTFQQCGKASWYKLRGMTASGEKADPNQLTAAHRTLPFGSLVDVTNLSNGKTVTVRINDRGPYSKGRVIDVTLAAAKKLGFVNKGVTRVRVSSSEPESGTRKSNNCQ